ncbi:sulfurtransferase [Parahaliea sp. F7430]|uniref:Sulfurtransferase n=1 Tax=Sediminihaliea albiluteola TaxID=2758564 RepID=A0A7W2TVU3_9GAMM|nr:sulfurtransferase [Sediminihaliea albiluteola]MBA6412883.1 sulfurtransferase [Sediminihaliea albiluteola]
MSVESNRRAALVAANDTEALAAAIVIDCRYSLADPKAGRADYEAGHIPGAFYLDLAEDLSGPKGQHGGRHPLPDPTVFAETLAALGVHRGSEVIAYDDHGFAFAARLWWMMRSLGYRPPRLLDGGYAAWLAAGGEPDTALPEAHPCEAPDVGSYTGLYNYEALQPAQQDGALLIDSRESRRYQGLEEPVDPVAGHIPGARNKPWQEVTTDSAQLRDDQALQQHWGEVLEEEHLVLYCGSGVTACVNLFALSVLGRDDAILYAGSWSDWCSYLAESREQ